MSNTITVVPDYTNKALVTPNVDTSIADILLDKLSPRLPGSGTLSILSAADVNAEVDTALNTAIPGSPTAGSANDVLKDLDARLPASTISAATDVSTTESNIRGTDSDTLKTLSDQLDALSLLSNKEKSLLGIRGVKGFTDYFNNVADGDAPDTTKWATAADTGTITVDTTAAIAVCLVDSSATGYKYGAMQTLGKNMYSLNGAFTELHLRARFKINDLSRDFFVGFFGVGQSVDKDFPVLTGHKYQVGLNCRAGSLTFRTDDGAATTTDASTDFTNDTYAIYEVVLSATSVKHYVDGVLKRTQTTNIPAYNMQALFLASSQSASQVLITTQYVEVWTE